MSDRSWRFYLDDRAQFAEKIISHSEGMSQEEFESNSLSYDAITRNIELTGEAVIRIYACVFVSVP